MTGQLLAAVANLAEVGLKHVQDLAITQYQRMVEKIVPAWDRRQRAFHVIFKNALVSDKNLLKKFSSA